MKNNKIHYNPIGIIHTPFKEIQGTPIQPLYAKNIKGTIELQSELVEGLIDLEGFSHVILLYHFHLSKQCSLNVVPFLDNTSRGVFATRAPARPNPIGLSIVKLVRIENNILHIENVDVVDGTPLLDIKPHIGEFEDQDLIRTGWLTDTIKNTKDIKADNRFG